MPILPEILRRLLAPILALLLLIIPAAAAETRVALVIGNSAYRNTAPLPNPRNDAAAMAEALQPLGFRVLSGFDLDRTQTEAALRDFADSLDDVDVALFYYAGHGLQVDDRNYILPVDARLAGENDLPFETVDLSLVLALMERQSRTNLVFLDSCRDNPLAQNLARSMGASRSAGLGRGLAIAQGGIGTLLVYATQPGNVALDGAGAHSPFTQALLDNIATPDIEVRQMLSRVRGAVLAATDGRQVPWDHSSLTGDFFFVARGLALVEPSPAAPALPDREALFWDTIKQSNDPADFRAYLEQFPEGTFAALARNRLAQFEPQQAPAVTVASAPSPGLGLTVADLDGAMRTRYRLPTVLQGVVVTGVERPGLDFKPGDVIVEVDRVVVSDRAAFDRLVRAGQERRASAVSVLINRGGVFTLLPLTLPD